MSLVLVVLAGTIGVHLLVTSPSRRPASRDATWIGNLLRDRTWRTRAVAVSAAGACAFLLGLALFAGPVAALCCGVVGSVAAATRSRQLHRRSAATTEEAWPQMIEEIRLLSSTAGRSVPEALFEVGHRAPPEMRGAFDSAHREWLLTTDFSRSVRSLEDSFRSATADAVCETLLVAHQVGGTALDRRLEELAADRRIDAQYRKEARSKQAGVRFARRFVIIVPLGMAVAGLSLGSGREAYQTPTGQALVVLGVLMVAGCWIWSGHLLRLPEERRILG